MTTDARHPFLGHSNGGIHSVVAFVYADAAARNAALGALINSHPPSGDIGKVAFQSDDGSFWAFSGVAWLALTGGGGGGGGEANLGNNVGGGSGVFRDKTGVTLNFRSLVAGSSKVTVVEGADTVTVNAVSAQIESEQVSSPRPPTAHASSHLVGGGDAIPVATPSVAGLMSAADKTILDSLSGGGSADFRDLVLFDHFMSANADADEIGIMGWRTYLSGVGSGLDFTGEVGHPGVLRLQCGTAAAARAAIACGDSAGVGGKLFLGPTQNPITIEFLSKFSGAGSINPANLEEALLGFGLAWNGDNTLSNGVFLHLLPGTSPNYFLTAISADVATTVDSGVAAVENRWDRWEIVITPGSPISCQLRRNGVNVGSAITTNVPTGELGFGFKTRSAGGSGALLLIDYAQIKQVTAKEDP